MNAKKSSKAEAKADARSAGPKQPPRMLVKYQTEVLPKLAEDFGRTNAHSLPKLMKITINQGVGIAMQDKKHIEVASEALGLIAGQKPLVTRARLSVAGFKLREGVAIGVKVDLRGRRMWEFLDRLISVALPRVRDFRGVSPRGFDGHGNFSMGLSEQLVFPELNPDKYTRVQGMNITFGVKNASDAESLKLFTYLGMPFATDLKDIPVKVKKKKPSKKKKAVKAG
jgi:large subunit ribosomal protein L5